MISTPDSRTSQSRQVVTYRSPRSFWLFLLFSFLAMLVLTVGTVLSGLGRPYLLGLAAFSAFLVLAAVELKVQRVTVDPDKLTYVRYFRRRVIPRPEIDSVTWAKGSGVSLKLVDGRWVRLPEVGPSSQGLVNGVRAWLKRTAKIF